MTSGLDTSVDEALAAHTPDGKSPGSPGCYALEIGVPDNAGLETLSRQWLDHYESTPRYLEAIVDCDRTIYVGAAKDVRSRIEDHLESTVRKAALPSIWGVTEIVYVEWFGTAQAAFEHERRVADGVKADHPDAYVHCR